MPGITQHLRIILPILILAAVARVGDVAVPRTEPHAPVVWTGSIGQPFFAVEAEPPKPQEEQRVLNAASSGFVWPVSGPISSVMDKSHPLGIDVGLSRTPRAVIHAVDAGKVVFAGGRTCCSYGLYVMVEHANGLKTVYAHLSRIDVAVDDYVERNQPLGIAGDTGDSTATHLHFEVRGPDGRLNPLDFLPPACPFASATYHHMYAIANGDCRLVPTLDRPAGTLPAWQFTDKDLVLPPLPATTSPRH